MAIDLRPTLYPFIDTSLSNVDMNYQINPLNVTGFAPNDVIPSQIHNTLWFLDAWWVYSLDYGTLRVSDYIDDATPQQVSSTPLAYSIGGNVTGGGGAPVQTFATYIVDAYRITIDNYLLRPAGASPLLVPGATVPGRIWVYLDTSVINPPSQFIANIRVDSVGPGDPSTPGPGEISLVGVDVDAGGFVTGNTYDAPATQELKFGSRVQRWTSATHFDSTATFDTFTSGQAAAAFMNDNIAVATVSIENVGGGTSLDVKGPTMAQLVTCENIVATGGAAQPTISATAIAGQAGVQVTGNGNVSTSEAAVRALGSTGIAFYATTSGAGAVCYAEATGSAAVYFGDASAGTGLGASLLGGNSASGVAVQGQATHASASGVKGLTTAAASVTTYGVWGLGGSTSGSGVLGQGVDDGYGVVAQSDTTAPKRAAARLVPQDADPTSPQQGDLLFNSARSATGKLRVRTTQWESGHSSAKGYVFASGVNASGSVLSGVTSGDLSIAQISPEETGDVIVTAVLHLDWSADAASARVLLRDATAAATINGGGTGVLVYPIVGAAGRAHTAVVRFRYTLPSAATRSFAVRITAASGNVTYTDVTVTVQGVL